MSRIILITTQARDPERPWLPARLVVDRAYWEDTGEAVITSDESP